VGKEAAGLVYYINSINNIKMPPVNKLDIHQHLWSEPLVAALAQRNELPFVRDEGGLTVLFCAGERPYVIDTAAETAASRAALVERDGLDGALLCLSSPLGIESLPRKQALPLIESYLDGALSLGEPFGVWGALALDGIDPDDVDGALDRGCIGLSLPAGALAGVDAIARLDPVLARLQARDVPLLVHPGPGSNPGAIVEVSLRDPLWWPALTRYLAEMQAAWLSFVTAGRPRHPRLRVIFAMLAGLAPLHAERLRSRGGPGLPLGDPLLFYDTSSYGPSAIGALLATVGPGQLLFGSDRPVVEPAVLQMPASLDWGPIVTSTERALGQPLALAVL
jgi:6-methylsalicylate decarboxylase